MKVSAGGRLVLRAAWVLLIVAPVFSFLVTSSYSILTQAGDIINVASILITIEGILLGLTAIVKHPRTQTGIALRNVTVALTMFSLLESLATIVHGYSVEEQGMPTAPEMKGLFVFGIILFAVTVGAYAILVTQPSD